MCVPRFCLAGRKFACGTACHTSFETKFCASVVAQKVYSMARSGDLKLPGFPNFEAVMKELNQKQEIAAPDYEVTVGLPNGTLIIKQNLIDYWLKTELFAETMKEVLNAHNAKYNPHGVKRGADAMQDESGAKEGAPEKKMRLETSVKVADQEAKFGETLLGAGLLYGFLL